MSRLTCCWHWLYSDTTLRSFNTVCAAARSYPPCQHKLLQNHTTIVANFITYAMYARLCCGTTTTAHLLAILASSKPYRICKGHSGGKVCSLIAASRYPLVSHGSALKIPSPNLLYCCNPSMFSDTLCPLPQPTRSKHLVNAQLAINNAWQAKDIFLLQPWAPSQNTLGTFPWSQMLHAQQQRKHYYDKRHMPDDIALGSNVLLAMTNLCTSKQLAHISSYPDGLGLSGDSSCRWHGMSS